LRLHRAVARRRRPIRENRCRGASACRSGARAGESTTRGAHHPHRDSRRGPARAARGHGRTLPGHRVEPALPVVRGIRSAGSVGLRSRAARRAGERRGRSRRDARALRGRGRAARAGRTARPRDRRTARRGRSRAGHEPWLERCHARRPVRPPALRAFHQGGLVLEEKAEDLGRVLGQTDEYKALRRATEALREDQAVQKVLAEAEQLAQEIERAAQQGKEPTKEQVEQYDKALQSVQGNTVYQQMVAAQANFEKLMARINARIYEGIKKGSASPIITLG